MIKKIGIVVVILVLIAGAAIYLFGARALNSGIKAGVQTYGPKVTQTHVSLEDVNISLLSGSGSLVGLNVGNPEGYRDGNIFELGQIDVEIDKGSIFTDTIIINKIHIKEPGISYEKKLTSSNIKELQENIAAFSGKGEDSAEPVPAEESGSSKKLVIKELTIEGGKIYVGVLGVGQTVPLPRIEMKNLGEGGTETNAADVINKILSTVIKSIGPAVANAGELGKNAADVIKTQGLEKMDQATDKVGEGIKNLFGK